MSHLKNTKLNSAFLFPARTIMNGELPNRLKTVATDVAETTVKNVDFETIWQGRQRRQHRLLMIYMWVVAMVSLAWLVGFMNLSFTWLMAIFVITLTVWRTKVFRIIEEHLMQEQLLVHRKRALRGSETVEWLNFIINRWSVVQVNCSTREFSRILTFFVNS